MYRSNFWRRKDIYKKDKNQNWKMFFSRQLPFFQPLFQGGILPISDNMPPNSILLSSKDVDIAIRIFVLVALVIDISHHFLSR